MEYPLISEYRDAILSAEDNFNELSSLRPVLDSHGDPVMSSGNFAVVFKMRDESDGKLYAVKCFIKDQAGRDESYRKIADELEVISSSYILPLRYLENELFVDSAQCDREEFPVVVMEWVEGETLDAYLNRNLNDKYELEMLSYRFNRMAAWLLAQPFAHGDLKPDNILVRKDGSLVLVDYDGMFVPSMKGEKAREIGSPDYRHPVRTDTDFDEHIDDFSIAVIALSLKAIAVNPQLRLNMTSQETLLFKHSDFYDIIDSPVFNEIHSLFKNSEILQLYGIFSIAFTKCNLSKISSDLILTDFPQKQKFKKKLKNAIGIFSSCEYICPDDQEETEVDEFGFMYSKDGQKLIRNVKEYVCNEEFAEYTEYSIKAGTVEICDEAFSFINTLRKINIPNTVKSIGNYAFQGCKELLMVNIPESINQIGKNPFRGCSNLQLKVNNDNFIFKEGMLSDISGCLITNLNVSTKIIIPHYITSIGDSAFQWNERLDTIHIHNSVVNICDCAFACCTSLKKVYIPNAIESIGNDAFNGCVNLSKLYLPNSLKNIGNRAFSQCESLKSLYIPSSIVSIGVNPFIGCLKLYLYISTNNKYKIIDDFVIDVENSLLISYLKSKEKVVIPQWIECIGEAAFWGHDNLKEVVIPQSVTTIKSEAFYYCESLTEIKIPSKVTIIGDAAFKCCTKLNHITLPNSIDSIGFYAFSMCNNLKSITIPKHTKYQYNTFESQCKVLFKDFKIKKTIIPKGGLDY